MHRLLTSAAVIGILILGGGNAVAQQQFDGRWDIQATPQKGACKRTQRFAVTVQEGTVRSRSSRQVEVTGGLDPSGRVQGSAVRNKTRVSVTGSLSGRAGSGDWGTTGRVTCSGRWTAEKRG